MKKLVKVVSLVLVMVLVVACGSKNSNDGETVKVGIIQSMDHPALNAVRENFVDELKAKGYEEGKNLEINYQNGQGDQSNLKTIASKLAKDSDLVFAIGTQAAQSMSNETKDIPIIFSAVTNPVESGLVKDMNKPDGNVTGTTDAVDIQNQIDLIKKTKSSIKTVGIIYNAGEANSKVQVKEAKDALNKANIEVKEATVASTNDTNQAAKSLVGKVDALYIPTDNTLASSISAVSEIASNNKIPLITAFETENDSLASCGINYGKLGVQSATMALKVLKDKVEIANIAVESSKDIEVKVNEEIAKEIGIDPNNLK